MNSLAHKRQQILQQMEQIRCMERGSLQAEMRPSPRHPDQNQGPYFKHQVWEEGRNVTRRVPPEKAPALVQAIEGRKEFEKLAEQFVHATVAMTRAQSSPESKKTGRYPRGAPTGNRRVCPAVPKSTSRATTLPGLRAEVPGVGLPIRQSFTPACCPSIGGPIRCFFPTGRATAICRTPPPGDHRTLWSHWHPSGLLLRRGAGPLSGRCGISFGRLLYSGVGPNDVSHGGQKLLWPGQPGPL